MRFIVAIVSLIILQINGFSQNKGQRVLLYPYAGSVDMYVGVESGLNKVEHNEHFQYIFHYTSTMWNSSAGVGSGIYDKRRYTVSYRWMSINTGVRIPIISYMGLNAGVSCGLGYGNQLLFKLSTNNPEITQNYNLGSRNPYYCIQVEAYTSFNVTDEFSLAFRGGLKSMKMDRLYMLPNLELSFRYLFIELGVSANLYEEKYYRQYSTGQIEIARTEKTLGAIYLRGILPISDPYAKRRDIVKDRIPKEVDLLIE